MPGCGLQSRPQEVEKLDVSAYAKENEHKDTDSYQIIKNSLAISFANEQFSFIVLGNL